ncbi:hypothetical protein [Pygmaiobacter massiliensis]|uniref:hypothetical protein n=1 Tax=Pygmaiobacter massiliensis TaxID=1917873 RepID=UPI002897CDAC|nr:hypothetical protein [Pygmaiobacter massiliensis]
MQYRNTNDIKHKIKDILDSIDTSNDYYGEFKWFSKVNYTTTTEYYGELRIFLLKVIQDERFVDYKSELQELYNVIDAMLFPKIVNR